MDRLKALRAAFEAAGFKGATLGLLYNDIQLRTNAELVEWAAEAGATLTTTTINGRSWEGYETTLDDLPLYVTGPHRVEEEKAA